MQLCANNYFLQFFISETQYIALINFVGNMPEEPTNTSVVAYQDAITPLIGKVSMFIF